MINIEDMYTTIMDLKGETLKRVWMSSDRQELVFECASGSYKFVLDNDCCSDGWVEHFTLPYSFGSGVEITEITEKSMDALIPTTQDVDLIYSYSFNLKSNKNIFSRNQIHFEFRNSSNGYYGSSMDFEGVVDTKELDKTFKVIEESF